MNVFLSNPAVLCAAGRNPEEFLESLSSGNQGGIVREKCGEKEFFVGKIKGGQKEPKMRVLEILDCALDQIRETVEKAVGKFGPERVGVCLGSCDNGSDASLSAHGKFFSDGKFPEDYDIAFQGADYPARFASQKFGLGGISLSFSTACSSSASAILKARELILAGVCDAVLAGGVDVASPTVLLGFDSLEAVSPEIANPMSANRKGITLGEGAALFVLSKEDLEGTGVFLAGAGESSDASHMTAPLADGSGAKAAMERALADAGLSPLEIDYLNLHATGTLLNDAMESRAVADVFGSYPVPSSGTKPLTGHTLGAAGALELCACFLAIKNQILPVHKNDGIPAPDLPPLNLVRSPFPTRKIRTCMSNTFAFGGCNVSLVISAQGCAGKHSGREADGTFCENRRFEQKSTPLAGVT